ncbi:NAD(P)H-dependent FMN reductase C4B3.06c [Orchesella cincta]|uniref:NAD(P)H-dependent FMN reductase C4B3.06c n=1 Tax=Orchesella cincta TaxID=48709 RepID=A0A1D2MKS4_ORCCI|nr:NAD(P)H-dependent FMN reductase C4B3.06c [Orchesella cincta]
MPSKILIFLGSVRPARLVERIGIAVKNIVTTEGMEPEIIDPAELPFEIVKVPMHFMVEPEKEAPEWMLETNKKIQNADGYIIVCPEYNCVIPPALCNMLDHFPPSSFRHRPCGIVTYSAGTYGGIRVATILRPFVSELGMVSVPAYVAIPTAQLSIEADGTCSSERISNNLTKLVKEVEWYASALQNHKANVPPPQ